MSILKIIVKMSRKRQNFLIFFAKKSKIKVRSEKSFFFAQNTISPSKNELKLV
jgi:hypothetical protein